MRVEREKLLRCLEAVSPGLSAKEIIEQSCHFVFRGGRVITFNDEVACSLECSLELEGAVVAEPLLNLLRKLPEDNVDLEVSEGELLIRGQKRKAGIRLEQKVTLPIEGIEVPKKWKPLPANFVEAVGIVQACAGRDESRFALTCIHLSPEWVEACDGFQLARYPIKIGVTTSTIVRRRAMKSVVGLDVTEFSQTENWIHFRNSAGLLVSCRRYLDKYPSIEKLLQVSGQPTVLPKGLEEAVDKAQIFSTEDNQVKVELRRGKLRLSGKGANGWYAETKSVKYSGDELQFSIAPKLLVEISHRAEKCEVAEGRLKISTDKWTYVTCTGKVVE